MHRFNGRKHFYSFFFFFFRSDDWSLDIFLPTTNKTKYWFFLCFNFWWFWEFFRKSGKFVTFCPKKKLVHAIFVWILVNLRCFSWSKPSILQIEARFSQYPVIYIVYNTDVYADLIKTPHKICKDCQVFRLQRFN